MVVGVGLAVGAMFGRAYSLIFLGLILVGLVQLTSWFDIDLGTAARGASLRSKLG